jgi:hypothetical protein
MFYGGFLNTLFRIENLATGGTALVYKQAARVLGIFSGKF